MPRAIAGLKGNIFSLNKNWVSYESEFNKQ